MPIEVVAVFLRLRGIELALGGRTAVRKAIGACTQLFLLPGCPLAGDTKVNDVCHVSTRP